MKQSKVPLDILRLKNVFFYLFFFKKKGPYAFVFYLKRLNCIYFGRDRFGRRSLLINASNKEPVLMVSSVQLKLKTETDFQKNFDELKANRVYKLDVNNQLNCLEVIEWKKKIESDLTVKNG